MLTIRSSGLDDSGSEKDGKAEKDEVRLEHHVMIQIRHENGRERHNVPQLAQ